MKIALATTTVHVPRALAVYRKFNKDVRFFVAVDKKTPDAAMDFMNELPDTQICQGDKYKCSELIGWNCIQRRAIAVLEALKWGAETIIVWDDDNLAMNDQYFYNFESTFLDPLQYLKAMPVSGWFDSGSLLTPQIKQRGFPVTVKSENVFEPITDAKIGVATGLILGDADMDAHTRVTNAPLAYSVHELAREGVLVDPKETWTPFNTQNTAYLRELAPAMFCAPGIGRHDDIFASLITQRIMRERDLFVHVGQPFVYQQRNQHDLLKDMGEELFGMSHILEFADVLNNMNCASGSVLQDVRSIYERLWNRVSWYPPQAVKTALAFLDDCESVL